MAEVKSTDEADDFWTRRVSVSVGMGVHPEAHISISFTQGNGKTVHAFLRPKSASNLFEAGLLLCGVMEQHKNETAV